MSQVALGITSHDKFRNLLLKVEPQERYNCYHSLKSRLRFEAKPLETYIMEGRMQADAEKLPTYDHETGTVRDYSDPGPINLNALAEKAIREREAEEIAKGSLEMVCRRCTYAEVFPGKTRGHALRAAELKGWRPDAVTDKALCPKCAPKPN